MRHAEARWKDPRLSDLERPLNRRGSAAAEAMARRLLERQLVPDLLLVSPALRTRQTADIVARELSLPARRVLHEEALYLASAADMLKVVHGTGPRVTHLLLVAHNPGISELVQLLLPQAAPGELPAAGVCSIAFGCNDWEAVSPGGVTDAVHEAPPTGLFGLFS